MTSPKQEEIKVRVTSEMKARVLAFAAEREESESVIVREALNDYFKKRPTPKQSRRDPHQSQLHKAARALEEREAQAVQEAAQAPKPVQSAQ